MVKLSAVHDAWSSFSLYTTARSWRKAIRRPSNVQLTSGGRPSDVCWTSVRRPLDVSRTSAGRLSDLRRTSVGRPGSVHLSGGYPYRPVRISYAYEIRTNTKLIRVRISHAYEIHTRTNFVRVRIPYAYEICTRPMFVCVRNSYAYEIRTRRKFVRLRTPCWSQCHGLKKSIVCRMELYDLENEPQHLEMKINILYPAEKARWA